MNIIIIVSIIALIFTIAALIFWIWSLIDCSKNTELGDKKLLFTLLIIFLGIIGSFIYLFVRKKNY